MTKDALDLSQQITLLQRRGLPVADGDRQRLARLLIDRNYYRLSGYWRYFQRAPHRGDNAFDPTATVKLVEEVYTFDATLRSILLEGLADFEVAFRSRLAYYLATGQGPCTYRDAAAYRAKMGRRSGKTVNLATELVQGITKDISRSREDYIKHHTNQQEPVPIWVAIEVLSFGTVSKLYYLLDDVDTRTKVSKSFDLPSPEFLDSLTHSFSVLRNICAHHGRVWNRRPEVPLKVLNALKTDKDRGIYQQTPWAWLVMLAHLVDRIRRDRTFSETLWTHVDTHTHLRAGLTHPHRR